MACDICAKAPIGKNFAVMTTSAEAQGIKSWHRCYGGAPATSRAVSWHLTHDAAERAAKAFRKQYKARAYTMRVTH